MRPFTYAEALSMTRHCIEDANIGRTWKNHQVRSAINTALQHLHDIAVSLNKGWFETSFGFGLTAGRETYVLPSQAFRIISVEYHAQGQAPRRLERVWLEDRNRFITASGMQQGSPQYYYIRGGNLIGLLPVPQNLEVFRSEDSGPLRINYTERISNVETLDTIINPYEASWDGQNVNTLPYQGWGVLGQGLNGPLVLGEMNTDVEGANWPKNSYFEIVAFFTLRDRDQNIFAPPLHRSPPWISLLSTPNTDDDFTLDLTTWPEDDAWPVGSTHLDIWCRFVNAASEVNGTKTHMHWLATIKRGETETDPIRITMQDDSNDAREGLLWAMEIPKPGYVGPGLFYGTQLDPFRTVQDYGLRGTQKEYGQKIINLFPKSWKDRTDLWPPFGTRTGSGVYTDTIVARADADIIHDAFYEEFIEILGVRAALNLNLRHGIQNQTLMLRWRELEPRYREMIASRDMAKRRVVVNNPDPSNRSPVVSQRGSKLRGE